MEDIGKVQDGGGGDTQVFVDRCLVCNGKCFLPPKLDVKDRTRANDMRELFYALFNIPTTAGFIRGHQDELPLCSGCVFKLGKVKILKDQLSTIQKQFMKIKEAIAFDIVDVVAGSEASKWGNSLNFKEMSKDHLQEYLKNSEIDTLQQFIFDEWHEKYSDPGEKECSTEVSNQKITTNKPNTTSAIISNPLKKSIVPRMTNSNSISNGKMSHLILKSPSTNMLPNVRFTKTINKLSNHIQTKPSLSSVIKSSNNGPAKTTVISITTDDGSRTRKPETLTSNGTTLVKRKLNPEKIQSDKRAKSIEIVVGEEDEITINSRNAEIGTSKRSVKMEETSNCESKGPVVLSKSISPTSSYQGNNTVNIPDTTGDSGSFNLMEKISKRKSLSNTSSTSPVRSDEMDFENYRDITDFLAEENEDDGGEEIDLESKQYVENLMAELSGGNNVEFQQNEEGLYVCMFCSKTFIHKYPYRDHLKTHTGEGPRCPICNKIFPKNHNLMLHLRTHTGEKPFKCDVCYKGFADKSNLKVHYRVHTGEKPYQCEYCELAFVNSSRLVVHRRLHTGEKPFTCENLLCGKTFATSNQLATHRKVHGEGVGELIMDEYGEYYVSGN